MIFTPGQCILLFIVTEFFVFCFLSKVLDTLKCFSLGRAYRKQMEYKISLLKNGIITPNDFLKMDETDVIK